MKKIILATIISAAMSVSAFADQGHGKVTFKGEIISAPCSISPESIDQTVPLGQISNSLLVDGGTSSPKTFTIDLEDCVLDAAGSTVAVSFTGASSAFNNGTLLSVTGLSDEDGTKKPENIAIQINDSNGTAIAINDDAVGSGLTTLQPGTNSLLFSAFVRSSPDSTIENIPLGQFEGVTNFTLTYN